MNPADETNRAGAPSLEGEAALPAYDPARLSALDPDHLIALLVRDEDRTPRAVIDECASRGEAMVERLAMLVAPDSRWSEPETIGEWWLRLHAVMILGLIADARAGALLVSFMRRMERANDEDLQDWLAGYWPIFFRNKTQSAVPALRALAQDRAVDWYMRIQAVDAVLGLAERAGTEALDAALDWVAGIAGDEAEDFDMRLAAGNDLLDFPRERHRSLLRNLAKRQSRPIVQFTAADVADAYAKPLDRPEWRERDDPWKFYAPSSIAERQERWAREAAGEDDADDDLDEPLVMPFVRAEPKVGRNDPCPCGSGKKYKKCCLDKSQF